MKHSNLLRAVQQAGFQVISHDHHHYESTNGNQLLEWIEKEGEANCVRCGHVNDPRDIMTDYFPGWKPKTIKQAVSHLRPLYGLHTRNSFAAQ
jgi:hypothetical protein